MQEKHTGGIAMTDLNLRLEANQENGKESLPTMVCFIYILVVFYLKFLYPHFARNIYVHTLNAPKFFFVYY